MSTAPTAAPESAKRPDETYDEYAARLLEQHGPPPAHVVDMVQQLQRQAATHKEVSA